MLKPYARVVSAKTLIDPSRASILFHWVFAGFLIGGAGGAVFGVGLILIGTLEISLDSGAIAWAAAGASYGAALGAFIGLVFGGLVGLVAAALARADTYAAAVRTHRIVGLVSVIGGMALISNGRLETVLPAVAAIGSVLGWFAAPRVVRATYTPARVDGLGTTGDGELVEPPDGPMRDERDHIRP